MKASVICLLLVGISGAFAQPVPVTTKNGTAIDGSEHPVGSPSEFKASKIASSGVASASLSYGKVAVPSYDYPSLYPTASCHGHAYGYYGNPAQECKVFHHCGEDGRLETFDCPPYTKFNNYLSICDWPHKVDYNCDPVYKDEGYPAKSYNNAYPADRSYAPNFLHLYPVAKPVYAYEKYERPVYPVLPAHKSYPVSSHSAKPHMPSYEVYEKPYTAYHEKSAYGPVYEKLSYKTPVYEKIEKYETPVYGPIYEKVEKYDKPVYEKVSYKSYPEKPAVINYDYKPVYHAKKPVHKPVYGDYVEEKPYPVEVKPAYPMQKPHYAVEKTVYPTEKTYQEEKTAYPIHKAEAPVYQEVKAAYVPVYNIEKPVYEEKPAYDKYYTEKYPTYQTPAYPEEKPVYEKSAPVYPQGKPQYIAPAYQEKYPALVPAYPVENPLYQEYPVDKYEYVEKPYVQEPNYPKAEAYAEKPYTPMLPFKPAYERKYDNSYPTSVASHAAGIKNYNEYASRYEPRDFAYGVAPYSNYRTRQVNYAKSH